MTRPDDSISRPGAIVRLLAVIVASLAAASASASGRIELNQTIVDAVGGFPYAITEPRNFVLTGPLVVPANTDGLLLWTNEVVIDLNGFSISGPETCTPGACSAGIGSAIRGVSGIAHANRTTLRNGIVRGFGSTCVQLGAQARVEGLLVLDCGRFGVSVSNGSLVNDNRVIGTGEEGILLSGTAHPPVFGGNTVASSGLADPTAPAVSGGRASASNSCADDTCGAPDTRRSYYLTTTAVQGDDATTACDPGFHMASFWELRDPSVLRYDATRGPVTLDAGEGPPTGINRRGWVRTGAPGSATTGAAGEANCNAWTFGGLGFGTVAYLPSDWSLDVPTTESAPWITATGTLARCQTGTPVWCIENGAP